MSLRKHGAEKFPDGLETDLEIAAMEDLSERVANTIYGILDETETSA